MFRLHQEGSVTGGVGRDGVESEHFTVLELPGRLVQPGFHLGPAAGDAAEWVRQRDVVEAGVQLLDGSRVSPGDFGDGEVVAVHFFFKAGCEHGGLRRLLVFDGGDDGAG
jgi:hypothetical protein